MKELECKCKAWLELAIAQFNHALVITTSSQQKPMEQIYFKIKSDNVFSKFCNWGKFLKIFWSFWLHTSFKVEHPIFVDSNLSSGLSIIF